VQQDQNLVNSWLTDLNNVD